MGMIHWLYMVWYGCHGYSTMDKKNLRNLTTEEIIGQLMLAKSSLNDWMGNITPQNGNALKITNVVMMGMISSYHYWYTIVCTQIILYVYRYG